MKFDSKEWLESRTSPGDAISTVHLPGDCSVMPDTPVPGNMAGRPFITIPNMACTNFSFFLLQELPSSNSDSGYIYSYEIVAKSEEN